MKTFDGAVIYTDGSAKPNPGNTGWGVHGYFYNTSENTKRSVVAKFHLPTTFGYIHQNEDGQNPRAFLVEPVEYIDGFGSGEKLGSNNGAEVDALYAILLRINEDISINKLQIFTDSEYLRKGVLEWRALWERSNYKRQDGREITNKSKWIRLFDQIDILKSKDVNLDIDWVKGHKDTYGNIVADRLATLAMLYTTSDEPRIQFDFSPARGYWKVDIDRHPFLDFSRLFFNSQPQYNMVGQYYLADPGKDELVIGKKLPDTSYCVIKMTDKYDPVIEAIKQKQFQVSKDINAIMMLRLERIYQPDIYKYVSEHGDKVLYQPARNNVSLNFIDQKPITVEINPAGLSIRAIEALMFLEDLMSRYLWMKEHGKTQNQDILNAKDVTDFFFEKITDPKKVKKGKSIKLKDAITQQTEKIDIPVSVIRPDGTTVDKNIPLVLGSDVLRRNGLKRVEDMNPSITLLTWYESHTSIRYACVIETEGAIGIWSNFYADRIFF